MELSDLVWQWVAHKNTDEIGALFEFGAALELLASSPKTQKSALGGECPFNVAWYDWCSSVSKYRDKLLNNSVEGFSNSDLLLVLNELVGSFDMLTGEECVEGNTEIFSMPGWCKIRELAQVPLKLISWEHLSVQRDDIYEML